MSKIALVIKTTGKNVISVHYIDDDESVYDSGWTTNITIPANKRFRLTATDTDIRYNTTQMTKDQYLSIMRGVTINAVS